MLAEIMGIVSSNQVEGQKSKSLYTDHIVLLAVFFVLAALASAQDLDSAARELARKVAAVAGRQDVALTVRNASALSEAEVAQVGRALEAELRARPARTGAERVPVNVTLSENIQTYLWVAEIGPEVVMQSVARPTAPAASPAPVTIQKKLLWEQEKPILGAALTESLLIVLEPTTVSFYRERKLTQSLPVPDARIMPRDARGRLMIDGSSFRAFLPGLDCSGSIEPSPAITCAESNSSGLVMGRNYFSEPRLPPFFSTATLSGRRLVAGVDGRTRIYDAALREVGQVTGWGSDIAAVDSGCRIGVLATKPGEAGEADAIQLYELADRGVAPASEPATFSGPVTALWPTGRPGEAVAIARNSETGRYAAYSLAITCDR
jgi:hypothetical protein